MGLKKDKQYSEEHYPQVIDLLYSLFKDKVVQKIEIASDFDDKLNNTDIFIYLGPNNIPIRIGVRIRSESSQPYLNQISIRAITKENNTNTEYKKIVEEHKGDYMLYAISNKYNQICSYVLLDVRLLREFLLCSYDAPKKHNIEWNSDGSGYYSISTNSLIAYDTRIFVSSN